MIELNDTFTLISSPQSGGWPVSVLGTRYGCSMRPDSTTKLLWRLSPAMKCWYKDVIGVFGHRIRECRYKLETQSAGAGQEDDYAGVQAVCRKEDLEALIGGAVHVCFVPESGAIPMPANHLRLPS